MRTTIALAAAVLALAGCSSGSGSTSSPAAPAANATLAEVAAKIGCTGVEPSDAPLTKEYVLCQWKGSDLQLYRFGTPEAMANFWEMVKGFGTTAADCATVGLVVACPAEASNLAAVKASLS